MAQAFVHRRPESRAGRSIAGVDRLTESLVVIFRDGTIACFDQDFLYDHKDDNGNRTLSNDPEDQQ
jgi:hypothetical protein